MPQIGERKKGSGKSKAVEAGDEYCHVSKIGIGPELTRLRTAFSHKEAREAQEARRRKDVSYTFSTSCAFLCPFVLLVSDTYLSVHSPRATSGMYDSRLSGRK